MMYFPFFYNLRPSLTGPTSTGQPSQTPHSSTKKMMMWCALISSWIFLASTKNTPTDTVTHTHTRSPRRLVPCSGNLPGGLPEVLRERGPLVLLFLCHIVCANWRATIIRRFFPPTSDYFALFFALFLFAKTASASLYARPCTISAQEFRRWFFPPCHKMRFRIEPLPAFPSSALHHSSLAERPNTTNKRNLLEIRVENATNKIILVSARTRHHLVCFFFFLWLIFMTSRFFVRDDGQGDVREERWACFCCCFARSDVWHACAGLLRGWVNFGFCSSGTVDWI